MMELQNEYFGEWLKVIDANLLMKYKKMLMQAILNGVKFEPYPGKVFKAFHYCPYEKCVAIIIGQDPYPQEGVSTGIAFGNDVTAKGFKKISPSLAVIQESVTSLYNSIGFPNFDSSLMEWEEQGILMLNSALTVKTDVPGSHAEAWKPFIVNLVEKVSADKPNICWILLGKRAWEMKEYIKNQRNNVFVEYHPSFYARNKSQMPSKIWVNMIDYVKRTFNKDLKLYRE